MKHVIIATTAINRPMLHNDNMGEWLDWFLELNNSDTTLKWFLNIDVVDKLQCTYEETKTNFETLIANRVETTFLSNPNGKGNFLEACKRLSSNIVTYVDSLKLSQKEQSKIKIIWLEDDWKLSNVTKISCSEVVQNYTTDNSHTNLSFNRNNYIWALAPSVISYGLWKNLFYAAWSAETKPIDPEHCVGLYYRKRYGNPDLLCNITVINKSVKDKYLTERHMTFPESYYTYHNDKFQISNNDRYIFKDCLTSYLGDKMVFVRITSSFCADGCLYGRKFLEKYNIEKSHASDVNQFYAVTSDTQVKEVIKKEETPVNATETPKKEEMVEVIEPPKEFFLVATPDDGSFLVSDKEVLAEAAASEVVAVVEPLVEAVEALEVVAVQETVLEAALEVFAAVALDVPVTEEAAVVTEQLEAVAVAVEAPVVTEATAALAKEVLAAAARVEALETVVAVVAAAVEAVEALETVVALETVPAAVDIVTHTPLVIVEEVLGETK